MKYYRCLGVIQLRNGTTKVVSEGEALHYGRLMHNATTEDEKQKIEQMFE
jgi:hypothetical protein